MAYCKNCNKEISKFDSDICPFCGCEHPIEDDYQTMDITRNISKTNPSFQLYKSKKMSVYVILCCILGIFGIHEFYLGFKKKGLFLLGFNSLIILLEAIVGFIVFESYLYFIAGVGALFVVYLLYGLIFLRKKDSLKDAEGEFLR